MNNEEKLLSQLTPHDRKLIEDVNRANYRLRRRNTFFGVPAALLYNDYAQWEQAAKARGLILVGASDSVVAQTKEGFGHGAWFHNSRRGWLSRSL